MQIKFLKSIIENLAGKQAVPIVSLLAEKKDVNEFLIANKLKLTINQTRNILYKLSDFGLVSFIRKKDKRKGWYIYFWTLNISESLNFLEQKLKRELEQLEAQLKSRKEKRYYFCKTCNIEVNEEAALQNNFICSECEEVYDLSVNDAIIIKLEEDIAILKKELESVSKEREIEVGKDEKKKQIKIKRRDNKKKADRKKLKDKRDKEKEKALKSLEKESKKNKTHKKNKI
ncbi:MAG: hypothetical protein ACP5OG_04715 [Candidatus Nanoarchaeia archaeon]